MFLSKTLLAVLIIGTPNFIFQEGFISGAVATSEIICKAFTDALKHWREFESDVVSADVDFYVYSEAPKPDDDDDDDIFSFKFLEELFEDEDDDDDNNFNIGPNVNRIAVIIHGYMGDHKNEWIQDLIRALYHWRQNNMSVIVVDWFKSYTYHTAAGAVNEVANKTMKFLRKLDEDYVKKGLEKPYLHIMGHSLGAHIAGLTAKKLQSNRQFNWTVDRVTGFDPAKPFFNIKDDFEAYRLDKSHAKFVDVIHTNSAPDTFTFGLFVALGHVDFYPNEGDYQPACRKERGETQQTKIKSNSKSACDKSAVRECLKGLGNDVACISSSVLANTNMICDHEEAQKYFTKSLRGKEYLATRFGIVNTFPNSRCDGKCCGTSIPMGIGASDCIHDAYHGQYHVKVN